MTPISVIGKAGLLVLIAACITYLYLIFQARTMFPLWLFIGLETAGFLAHVWMTKQLFKGQLDTLR